MRRSAGAAEALLQGSTLWRECQSQPAAGRRAHRVVHSQATISGLMTPGARMLAVLYTKTSEEKWASAST